MSDLLPLNALRVLDAVVRTGSFSRAGEALFITQSAVSHQVKALEAWFGAPLFDRTGRGVKLLPKAQALAPVLSSALSDIEAACRRLRGSDSEKQLVVAVIPSVATCWLIPRLHEFRSRHPDVGLRIVYAIHGSYTDFGDVDLAITYAAQRPSGAGFEHFLDGAAAPVCSKSFAESHGGFSRVADVAQAQLLHDTDFRGWQKWFRSAGLQAPLLERSLVFADFNLLRAATLAGQGVSLCPLELIVDDVASGRLVKISDITVSQSAGYYVTLVGDRVSAASKHFRDWLLETARPADDPGF